MTDYFKTLPATEKELLQKVSFPGWCPVMLATLTDQRFSDAKWIYEPKFDGERALAYFQNDDIKLFTRNQHNINKTYPDLVEAFQTQKASNFIVDGEIIAFDEHGLSNFAQLQQRLGVKEISLQKAREIPVYYYLFDILYLNGYDLRKLSLKARQVLLKKAIQYQDPLRLTQGVTQNGIEFYQQACGKSWEGVIAKNLDASYQGKRSRDWLKFKCQKSQELIIIGYTSPKVQGRVFGALLVGYYHKGELKYAGKVGTGFTENILASLKREMDRYVLSQSPLKETIRESRKVTWLQPRLVGEFAFTEWTRDGKLRHPRFKGLRYDKSAGDVKREVAK